MAALYWTVQGATIYVGWPLLAGLLDDWPDFSRLFRLDSVVFVGGAVFLLTALQAIFLFPIRRPAFASTGGLSLWVSVGLAALAAGALTTGLVYAMADIIWLLGTTPAGGTIDALGYVVLLPVMGWLLVTPLLVAFCMKGQRERALGRLSAKLFLGSVVEAAAIIPLDVMVRRKTDCYCGQGTFWTLTICAGVGTFALGPAIWLPLLAKRRKRWYAGRCDACGYDMSGCIAAERCPECGAGWKPSPAAPTPEPHPAPPPSPLHQTAANRPAP